MNPHLPPGLDESAVLAPGTLPRAWARRFAQDASKPVLSDDVRGWTSASELDVASRRVAGRLSAAGLRPGDRILMSAQSSIDLATAYVGAVRLGLVVVPANTAYREREVAYLVADADPAAAIVDDPERAGWIRNAKDVLVTTPDVPLVDGPEPPLDDADPGDPMLIIYTSGTTGSPKGAVLSHANALAGVQSVVIAWRWSPEDRLLLSLPLFHIHGLGVGLHGTLLAGASAVLYPRFDPAAMLAACRDATLVFGVPTMYARFAAHDRARELARLRLCVSGSAPLPPQLFAAIESLSGQRVLERYGMSETGMNVSNPYDGERRPGTVGFRLPGVRLQLAGDGEIRLKGPNVFAGYWQKPEATREAFDDDGWFKTGDLGALDEDGYLRIAGRSKELIITGGYNVYPREVEDVLREHPGVTDVAVAGAPDDDWGEIVTAYVVAPPGTDVLAFAAERLAPFKRPKRVYFVDDLPRNALGKVLKHELRPS